MYFELILIIALFLPIFISIIFGFFWLFWTTYKNFIQWFQIKEIDLEIYAERIKNQDQVITRNALENFAYFLGTIYMIWGLTIWALLQFETTYIFAALLDELLPAKALFLLGYGWVQTAKFSLLSRRSIYCRVEKKKKN